jgi:quercetin dioxygenase-like cupin family protein
MALVHAQPLDAINVRPLAEQLQEVKTHSLLKTDKLQLMRVVLAAGQTMSEHYVPGEVTIQCLEGEVLVSTPRRVCPLAAGELMALPSYAPHALRAKTDASLLVTMLLHP